MKLKIGKDQLIDMYKIILFLFSIFLLNGCMQSTAMVGPAMTFVSTGNVYSAGVSYGANKAVEKETGMTTSEILSKNLKKKENVQNNELQESLLTLIDLNFHKTRKVLLKKN